MSRVSEQVEAGVADQYADRGTSQYVAEEMHSQDDARYCNARGNYQEGNLEFRIEGAEDQR